MAPGKLHAHEVDIDADLVHRLLSTQFPRWSALPISPVDSSGTDHRIFRLGSELCVRLPRVASAAGQARREREWLPRMAPRLPLAIPAPQAIGAPGAGYPFEWAVYRWLPGEPAEPGFGDLAQAARDLAGFVAALRSIDASDAPARRAGERGGPLGERDDATRRAIAQLGGRIDGPAALRSWDESLAAPQWDGPPMWIHGDLLPANLLARGGRLCAVIDFGCLSVGDPACDLLGAWNVFDPPSRAAFRAALGADAGTWLRGRGWALSQAVLALPYYWDTNPGMVRQARRAVEQVLSDPR